MSFIQILLQVKICCQVTKYRKNNPDSVDITIHGAEMEIGRFEDKDVYIKTSSTKSKRGLRRCYTIINVVLQMHLKELVCEVTFGEEE